MSDDDLSKWIDKQLQEYNQKPGKVLALVPDYKMAREVPLPPNTQTLDQLRRSQALSATFLQGLVRAMYPVILPEAKAAWPQCAFCLRSRRQLL